MLPITEHPTAISKEICARIKFGSKLLAHACPISRRQALDAFAVGVRFMNWHELLTHLNKASDHAAISPDWINKLITALIVSKSRNAPLTTSHVFELERIAERISGVLGLPQTVVLEQVLAKLCSAGSWSEVTQSAQGIDREPLYVLDLKWGHLSETPLGSYLDGKMDEFFENDESYEDQNKWLERTLLTFPQYLRAADHLSHRYMEAKRLNDALKVIDESLNTILPSGRWL